MNDDIFANIPNEGSDPFKDLVKDTPSESQPEKDKTDTPGEGEQTPEKEVPFHQHPRWIEREKKLETLEQENARVLRELDELKKPKEDTKVPDWFKELHGDNAFGYQKWQEQHTRELAELEEKAVERIKQEEVSKKEEEAKWVDYNNRAFESLEAEVGKIDRNKLSKILLDYAPTDVESGLLDFKKGYEIYKALEPKENKEHSQARKELGDTTTRTAKGEPKPKDYLTNIDLRNKRMESL